jgi:hypothetical protein
MTLPHRVFVLSILVALAGFAIAAESPSASNGSPFISNAVSAGAKAVKDGGQTSFFKLGEFSEFLSAVTSIVNLVLVAWLYILADRNHKVDRKVDADRKDLERKVDFSIRESERRAAISGFWIQELVMRPNHILILGFFDTYEDKLRKLRTLPPQYRQLEHQKAIALVEQEIGVFKEEYTKIRHRVVDPLMLVNKEFSALLPIMEEVEDLVINALATIQVNTDIPGNSRQKKLAEEQLAEFRGKFLKTIHEIQTKVVHLDIPSTT